MFSVGCPHLLLSQDDIGKARIGAIPYHPFLISSFEHQPVSLLVCSVVPGVVCHQLLTPYRVLWLFSNFSLNWRDQVIGAWNESGAVLPLHSTLVLEGSLLGPLFQQFPMLSLISKRLMCVGPDSHGLGWVGVCFTIPSSGRGEVRAAQH